MDSAIRKDSEGKQIALTAHKHWIWSHVPTTAAKAIGGSIGGVVEASCLQPIDVVKTRLQLDHSHKYKGIRHCMWTVANEEGTRALWKGLTPFATHLFCKYAVRFGSNAMFEDLFRSKDGSLSTFGRLGAGMGAGCVEALCIVTPFEVIKITLQKQKGLSKDLLKYKGPIHAASLIVKEEGPFGLWKGASPTVLRNGTNQTALFFTKPLWDKYLWDIKEGDGKKIASWQSLVSGLFAACLGPCVSNPFDVIKTRLMAQEKAGGHHYRGLFHALVTIPREEGVRALYKGLLPRLMRVPPGQAIVWMVRDQVVQFIQSHHD